MDSSSLAGAQYLLPLSIDSYLSPCDDALQRASERAMIACLPKIALSCVCTSYSKKS